MSSRGEGSKHTQHRHRRGAMHMSLPSWLDGGSLPDQLLQDEEDGGWRSAASRFLWVPEVADHSQPGMSPTFISR